MSVVVTSLSVSYLHVPSAPRDEISRENHLSQKAPVIGGYGCMRLIRIKLPAIRHAVTCQSWLRLYVSGARSPAIQ